MSTPEERRAELANKCAKSIEDHYRKALTRTSADDIVVFVLDCDDPAANALARKFFGNASTDKLIADARQRSGRPIRIADGPYDSSRSAIQTTTPNVTIPLPTRGVITYVVVSDGGISAGVMRTKSEPPISFSTMQAVSDVSTGVTRTKPEAHDSYPDTETIVASAADTIRSTYTEAVSDGKKDPIVFLLDCKDSIGGNFARRFIPSKVVDQQVAVSPSEQPVPVCFAFPYARARQLLRDSFSGLQTEELPFPRPGEICVVAIANKAFWVGAIQE
jgi:hypothetical protein